MNIFNGNSLECVLAKNVLEELGEKNLISQSKIMGDYLKSQLTNIKGISNITGRGLFIGLQINNPEKVVRLLKEERIILGLGYNSRIRINLPIAITKEKIDFFINKLSIIMSCEL